MNDTISLDSFDDFLTIARQQIEPQRLLIVLTRRELPEGYTQAMEATFKAGRGGHLAPVACVDKDPEQLTDFDSFKIEADSQTDWDIAFVAALSLLPGQPVDDSMLDRMVEAVRQGGVSGYLAFDREGNPLQLAEG